MVIGGEVLLLNLIVNNGKITTSKNQLKKEMDINVSILHVIKTILIFVFIILIILKKIVDQQI